MFMTDKMECFWILFLVYLTAFNSVECGDNDCRAIQSQDANYTTTALGLFALNDDGIRHPVNQIHIEPESAEAFILTRDYDSFTHDQITVGLTKALVFNFGPAHMGHAPPNLETMLRSLQEGNSRLDIYYFYYENTCDIWVAAIFDTVQKEDGFYKNLFGNPETKYYSVVKFNSSAQVERLPSSTIMLAPKATMVYVNCNSDPTQLAAPPMPADVGKLQELNCQVRMLTEKVNEQEAALTKKIDEISSIIHENNAAMVAFSAYRGGHVVGDKKIFMSRDGTMKFPEVLTNVGGAYDPNSGAFTAPAHGAYQLAVGVQCSRPGTPLRLVCGNRHVMSLFTNCASNSLESNSVLVELDAGAKCRVKTLAGHGSTFYDILTTHFGRVGTSTFSGHLVTLT